MRQQPVLWSQVEAKKAVPKEEHPSGRSPESGNPQRTKKIFVGGLAPSVDESVLKSYFERFGEVCPGLPSLRCTHWHFLSPLRQLTPVLSCCLQTPLSLVMDVFCIFVRL